MKKNKIETWSNNTQNQLILLLKKISLLQHVRASFYL